MATLVGGNGYDSLVRRCRSGKGVVLVQWTCGRAFAEASPGVADVHDRPLPRGDVTYVRTPSAHQVDYLARAAGGEAELIQVCADASIADVAARELRALQEAATLYPSARLRLLTATADALPQVVPDGVVAQPAYEWMLAPASSG